MSMSCLSLNVKTFLESLPNNLRVWSRCSLSVISTFSGFRLDVARMSSRCSMNVVSTFPQCRPHVPRVAQTVLWLFCR